ncbi:MAG: hypothetical protein P8X46_03420 [Nitrospirales bacterium]
MSSSSTPLTPDGQKALAAHKALEFVQDGQILGLGTGSTVQHFLAALGQRVQQGLRVRGVPTSQSTAALKAVAVHCCGRKLWRRRHGSSS